MLGTSACQCTYGARVLGYRKRRGVSQSSDERPWSSGPRSSSRSKANVCERPTHACAQLVVNVQDAFANVQWTSMKFRLATLASLNLFTLAKVATHVRRSRLGSPTSVEWTLHERSFPWGEMTGRGQKTLFNKKNFLHGRSTVGRSTFGHYYKWFRKKIFFHSTLLFNGTTGLYHE